MLAGRHGAEPLEAVGLSILACPIARHLMRPRYRHYNDDDWSLA